MHIYILCIVQYSPQKSVCAYLLSLCYNWWQFNVPQMIYETFCSMEIFIEISI